MAPHGEIQDKVFSFIKEYVAENGESPTIAEMSEYLGITPPAVLFHLKNLEKKGMIVRSSKNRGIKLKKELDFIKIPVIGIANASNPLDIAEQSNMGYLQVDKMIIKNNGNLFAVKINGNSMNMHLLKGSNVPLCHGNYAVVDRKQNYNQGDVVLAVVNGGATIKVYKEIPDGVALVPNSSNRKHHPIYIKNRDQLVVNGKVIMAFKNPSIN